ncbi:MAG: RagB/SusD family nutrient uptake outer membrane protein [Alistipes sp.]|nr:RagB/SusD family nutrient uptake outer membrane protein [Alistipes sp.]
MKNILKIGFVALTATALLSGCIKETFPTSVATSDQVAANPAALESQVNGIAAFVNAIEHLGVNHSEFGYPSMGMIRDLMGEDVATVSSGYEHFSPWIEARALSDQYAYPQQVWNYYTKFLLTANSVISAVNEASASDVQKQYLGMAYCYRAMINLDMGRMFEYKKNAYTSAPELEGLTIPIIREDLTEAEARNNPRVSKEKLVEYILGDLAKAIDFFSDDEGKSSFKRMNKTQPDLSVAYGLQARAYLWAEDYEKARTAATNALAAGSYQALTEAQATDPSTGFNSATSNNSWMWCSSLVKEDDAVKSSILNFTSWIASETVFGYAAAGPYRMIDARLYSRIPASDWRKKMWKAPEGVTIDQKFVPATASYAGPVNIPEYGNIKFRPGSGNPDSEEPGAIVDYPFMRMEEMMLIIAEADARKGSSTGLMAFMANRNPDYVCTASGVDALVDEVFFQKRIEFWGEGINFFDYKRLGKGVTRGYVGTNHYEDARLNTDGLAPWMNFCIVRTEHNANPAVVSNPDPSDLIDPWQE